MRYLSLSVDLAPDSFVLDVSNPKTIALQQFLASQQFVVKLKTVKHTSTMVARITLGKGIVTGSQVPLGLFRLHSIYLLSSSEALPSHVMFKKLKP